MYNMAPRVLRMPMANCRTLDDELTIGDAAIPTTECGGTAGVPATSHECTTHKPVAPARRCHFTIVKKRIIKTV